MILCIHCGAQNREKSNFCAFCGSRLAEESFIVGRLVLLENGVNQEYLLAEADRHIGRDGSNDIAVDDPQMSARHARIFLVEGKFWVEDLGSRNGTYLNGNRISACACLQDEDLLKMGQTVLKFKV